MSNTVETASYSAVGLYMAYRAVRGFGYLILGRPVYNMFRRSARRRAVKWRALKRGDTALGFAARRFDAHRHAALMNLDMFTPGPVKLAGWALKTSGRKLFFISIDALPWVLKIAAPNRMEKMRVKYVQKRQMKTAKASLKRRAKRAPQATRQLVCPLRQLDMARQLTR